MITLELKDRDQFKKLRKLVEEHFPSTPLVQIRATKWNPGNYPYQEKDTLLLTFMEQKKKR